MDIPFFKSDDNNIKIIHEAVIEELKAMENTFSEGVHKAEQDGDPPPSKDWMPISSFLMYNIAMLNVMLSSILEAPCTHYGTPLPSEDEMSDEEILGEVKDTETGH